MPRIFWVDSCEQLIGQHNRAHRKTQAASSDLEIAVRNVVVYGNGGCRRMASDTINHVRPSESVAAEIAHILSAAPRPPFIAYYRLFRAQHAEATAILPSLDGRWWMVEWTLFASATSIPLEVCVSGRWKGGGGACSVPHQRCCPHHSTHYMFYGADWRPRRRQRC